MALFLNIIIICSNGIFSCKYNHVFFFVVSKTLIDIYFQSFTNQIRILNNEVTECDVFLVFVTSSPPCCVFNMAAMSVPWSMEVDENQKEDQK